LYYLALRAAGVPAELHIYEPGAHGVGLALSSPALGTWPLLLEKWLAVRGII
jgi:acetyl esterase/lipase